MREPTWRGMLSRATFEDLVACGCPVPDLDVVDKKFEFINPDAQKKFLELLNELKKHMTNMFFNDIENMVNNLSDGDIQRMKEMMKALNDMLVKKIAGEDPGSKLIKAQGLGVAVIDEESLTEFLGGY